MPIQQAEHIRYFTFDSLPRRGLVHALVGRQGGVSPSPWASLNVGGTVGDDPQNVRENRRRTFTELGLPLESMFDVWQVHSATVVCTQAPRPPHQTHQQADAILTAQSGVTLFMRFADCVPILLYDPRRRVIGLVHAGWKGTVQMIAAQAVFRMQEQFGVNPADILAGIGPSIAWHHYPVGPEVARAVQQAFGEEAAELLRACNGEAGESGGKLDLWRANELTLWRAGVRQIEVAGICTACDQQDWYSHRGEGGRTGRFGALIALK